MAIALKYQHFATARELKAFVVALGGGITTIVSITFDPASSQYVLFYT